MNDKNNIRNEELIRKGLEFIYPERLSQWKTTVRERVQDPYNGKDVEDALAIIKQLEEGASIEKTKELFNSQDNLGFTADMVKSIVFMFSKRGPEFYRNIADIITPEIEAALQKKEAENEKLAEKNNKDRDDER